MLFQVIDLMQGGKWSHILVTVTEIGTLITPILADRLASLLDENPKNNLTGKKINLKNFEKREMFQIVFCFWVIS